MAHTVTGKGLMVAAESPAKQSAGHRGGTTEEIWKVFVTEGCILEEVAGR